MHDGAVVVVGTDGSGVGAFGSTQHPSLLSYEGVPSVSYPLGQSL